MVDSLIILIYECQLAVVDSLISLQLELPLCRTKDRVGVQDILECISNGGVEVTTSALTEEPSLS